MASFTDNIQALTNFKPYVQQNPVEAMVNVGMQKQAQYESGVQKIQSDIDKVAGMDVVRDIDKQYLQSKLNQVGDKLKFVAAGDFSNFQLVNSVGGMVNSVAKDKNVQNAVYNTQRYRKEVAYGDDLRKSGKLSVNREYDFDRAVDQWMKGDISTPFTGEYKEHIDVNKKVMEVIKGLHPNASKIDIPYSLNPDGSVNTRAIAVAMQRQGVKEVSEGQIRTAINAILDSNDLDELASQGRYNYRGYDNYSLRSIMNSDYNKTRQSYQNTLDNLKKQLLTASDIKQQAGINQSIEYFTSLLGDEEKGIPSQLEANYMADLEAIEIDPDAVRSSLFTKNWLDQVANGFAYREVTNELLTSPLREDQWKQIKHNFEVDKERYDRLFKEAQLKQKDREIDLKQQELTPNATPYFQRSGDKTLDNVNSLANFASYNASLADENKAIVADLIDRYSSYTNKLSEDDILNRIQEYQNNKYKPKTTAEKGKLDNYLKNASILSNMKSIYDETERQVSDEYYKEKNISGEPVYKKLAKVDDLIIDYNGRVISFSPKEVYDLLSKEKNITTFVGSGGGGGGKSMLYIDEPLTERETVLKNLLNKRYEATTGLTGNPKIDSYIQEIKSLSNEKKVEKKEIDTRIAERLAPITGDFATEDAGINYGKPEQRNTFINSVAAIVNADATSKAADKNYDPSTALSMLGKDEGKNVEFTYRRKGGDNYLVLTDKTGDNPQQMIKVQPEFVARNPMLGSGYLNQNINMVQIMLRNKKSTNIFKDYDHAYYKAGEFGGYNGGKRTVTLPVAADIEEDGGQTFVVLKLNTTKGGVLAYTYPFPINLVDFETKDLPTFTDQKIISLFKQDYPDIENLIN